MTDEATREGAEEVTTEAQTTEAPKPTSPRQAAMDAAVAKRREQLQAEALPQDEQDEQDDPDTDPQGEPDEELVTIKVDGQTQQVPRSKVLEFGVRAMQKEIAADARMAEAANMRRQLEVDRAALQQRDAEVRALADQLHAKDKEEGRHPTGADDYLKAAESAIDEIYDGDKTKAAAALMNLMKGRETLTPETVQQMIAQASQQAKQEVQHELMQERWTSEARQAKEWFETEHKEIARDPQWRSLADRETLDLMNEHPDWSPRKIVEEAVSRVTQLRKSVSSVDRRGIKQKIDSPRAASGRQPAPSQPAPQTRSQYIQELRRSRGLPA